MFMLWFKRFLIISLIIYAVALGVLLLFENNLVYPGAATGRGNYSPEFEFEDVYFAAADGTKLHGWMIPYHDSQRYILYCHGNAENVACVGNGVAKLMGAAMKANVFVYDYRGFGKSAGSPTEAGIKMDTDAAMDWLCARFGIVPTDIIVEGFSIGGGPAVYIGMKRGAKGMVLQRTFSSLPDVAAQKHPWAPVRWLMQNRFDSAQAISQYQGPLLQSHGAADKVVPFKFGKKLYESCPSSDKQFFTRPDMDHFSAVDPVFLDMASQFADRLYGE